MAPSKKIMLFVCLLVAATAVVVPAVAQVGPLSGPLSGLLGGLFKSLSDLILSILNGLFGIIRGTIYCSANLNATIGSGGNITSPPLSNVTVQLRCGPGNGTIVASAITNSAGVFAIPLNGTLIRTLNSLISLITNPISAVLTGCRLVVATPIAQCNVTTPNVGTLASNIIPNGTIGRLIGNNLALPLLTSGPFL